MKTILFALLILNACEATPVCPEPVVCEIAETDAAELKRKLQWQERQISRLTLAALAVEVAKDRCPVPNCHCVPPHRRKHDKTPYLGIE